MSEVGFKISSRLLDHIGLAMYSSLPKAISELVANSYDADAENVRINIPEDLPNGEIEIKDNGSGMDEKFIENVYMNIGGMNRTQERTPKYDRLKIGSKGIGKLAGLGIASIMRVETIKDRKKIAFEIDRELLEKEKTTLENIKFPIHKESTTEGNGTKIILKNLLAHVSSIDEESLRRFLAQEFVSRENFNVWINGEEIRKHDISTVEAGVEIRNISEPDHRLYYHR
jgi:HSP90 family molecular chaperone